MYITEILLTVLAALNLCAFLVMLRDKRKSRKGGESERTPEGLIFFLATIFGSVGVYAGMLVFRHKTRRWYFQLGIPLLILQNAATLYVLWQYIAL